MSYNTAHTTTNANSRLRLLNKLKSGEFPLMTFMAISSVRMAQIVSLTGVDASIYEITSHPLFSVLINMDGNLRVLSSTASTETSATIRCTTRWLPSRLSGSARSSESGALHQTSSNELWIPARSKFLPLRD
jgi:hypothetical protein